MPFQIQGRSGATDSGRTDLGFKIVSPSYFFALDMNIKEGRCLAETDVAIRESGKPNKCLVVGVIEGEYALRRAALD